MKIARLSGPGKSTVRSLQRVSAVNTTFLRVSPLTVYVQDRTRDRCRDLDRLRFVPDPRVR